MEGPSLLLQREKKPDWEAYPLYVSIHMTFREGKETDALQGLEWDEQAQLKGVCCCFCFIHIILVRVMLIVIPFVFKSC